MCFGTMRNEGYQPSAEKMLAQLMKKEMGVEINEHLLRLFITSKWSRITVLAHSIHDKEHA